MSFTTQAKASWEEGTSTAITLAIAHYPQRAKEGGGRGVALT